MYKLNKKNIQGKEKDPSVPGSEPVKTPALLMTTSMPGHCGADDFETLYHIATRLLAAAAT
jgi:hypothetical protein